MPEHLQSVLYTAPPVVEGGRGFAPDLQTPFLTRGQGADLMAGPATGRGEAA
jgi:hypothetical protein